MKIAIFHYALQPVGGSQRPPRRGVLLQVVFRDGSVGYGDCHPWHELGDANLDLQLQLLSCGHMTPLLTRSLAAARADADARKSGYHLFKDLAIPASHHHMADLIMRHKPDFEKFLQHGPATIKIKVGIDPPAECAVLKKWSHELRAAGCRLRLDFNCRLKEEAFIHYLSELGDLREGIDFYEDPFHYQPQRWQKVREELRISLACDRESLHALSFPASCDVLVVKPAVQEIFPFLTAQRAQRILVITTYADHPIGQLAAAYVAACAAKSHPQALGLCGLLTHHAYETTPFSAALDQHETQLRPSTEGCGWGYDTLLKELAWQPLM